LVKKGGGRWAAVGGWRTAGDGHLMWRRSRQYHGSDQLLPLGPGWVTRMTPILWTNRRSSTCYCHVTFRASLLDFTTITSKKIKDQLKFDFINKE